MSSTTSSPNPTAAQPSGGTNSFVERQLSVVFELTDKPDDKKFQRIELNDLRISASIKVAGGMSTGEAQISIFGVSENLMNRLTLVGRKQLDVKFNRIYLSAGDAVRGMSTIFFGNIREAYGDYRSMPDVHLEILSYAMFFEKFLPIPVTSASGLVSVAALIQSISNQIGYEFVNHGVTAALRNPYYGGTALDQIKEIAKHSDTEAECDSSKKQINIWPKGSSRKDRAFYLSADTGMIGYPMISSRGIRVSTIFDPGVTFGSRITVKSDVLAACGDWSVTSISHNLESQQPNGSWFSYIEASPIGSVPSQLTVAQPV